MMSSVLKLLLVGAASISSVGAFSPSKFGTRSFLVDNNYRHGTATSIYMGWGPDPIWTGSEIKTNDSANQAATSIAVTVDVSPETAQDYKIPGQYVQVRQNEEGKPLFLAVASAPDAENAKFDFLIKKTDDNAWMTTGGVEVSQVLGGGFPIKEELDNLVKYDFPCQNILLFAAGSGIAPIRAAIESGELKTSKSGGRTARLYYGVRTEADMCFVDKFPEWESMGIEVVPVLSQPADTWKGRTGYVQNALEEDGK
ncbi:MAG: NAD(P)H-flavin reductase [Bacillariaceae sp.]|jgi:NAD(P)H-flavin reductase